MIKARCASFFPFVSVALLASASVFVAAPASAQDDPRKAQAEALFQEGLKLHDKDREADALEKFQKAYAIYPSPNTLVSVAREEQLVGRPLKRSGTTARR